MTRALKIVLGIQIGLGLIWTLSAAMAHGAGGLAAVGVFFFVYAIFALMFVFAAWAFWKYPGERRRAGWIMALPAIFWFAPLFIRQFAGDHLSSQQLGALLILAAIALVAICWFMPRRITRFIPDGLIRSRLLNWSILLSVIGGWLFFIAAIIYVANDKPSSTVGGEGFGMSIIFAALYLIWVGVGSFLAATWSWLCLRSETTGTRRRLSIAQIVVSLPGVLLGAAVAFWLAGQSYL